MRVLELKYIQFSAHSVSLQEFHKGLKKLCEWMIIEIHLTFVSSYIISSIHKYRPQREIVWPKTEIVSSYSSLYITSQFTLVSCPPTVTCPVVIQMSYQVEGKCLLHLIALKGKQSKAYTVVKLGMCKHRIAVCAFWFSRGGVLVPAQVSLHRSRSHMCEAFGG